MTGEHPDRQCQADDCDEPAVGRLFGGAVDPDDSGLRCRDCLVAAVVRR